MPEPAPQTLEAGAYAERLITALASAGVTDFVVCPGSRSQGLALAAARADRRGTAHLHVRIDERSAAFLALGFARETRTPVAVIVTSGTAVANLAPAFLEAHHSDVPLIAITADRPAELQGIRANQTTKQPGALGDGARVVIDISADNLVEPEADAVAAVSAALGWREAAKGMRDANTEPGPVQLNVAFRAPLSGGAGDEEAPCPSVSVVERPPLATTHLEYAERTVVIAGADAGPSAASLAEVLGAPLIAEPTSNARFGPHFVRHGREVVAQLAADVRRVVVVGHPTLSRSVTALIAAPAVEVVVIGRALQDNVRGTSVTRVLSGRVQLEERTENEEAWVARWVAAGRAVAAKYELQAPSPDLSRADYAKAALAESRLALTRRDLVTEVWERTWPHDRLVVAASRLIRELDDHAGPRAVTAHANRGLAGIDGTVSTASGIALAHARAATGGITRLLIGDLAMLHDVGGLLLSPGEARPHLQIVVGNDRGGSLFSLLEVAGTADPDEFRRVQSTPHDVQFEQMAAAYGWRYERVTDRAGLRRALSDARGGIVEVVLAGAESDARTTAL